MTKPENNRGMVFFTLTIYWGCILLGLTLPWLATVGVDMGKHHQSFGQAFHQLRLHLFAPGYSLFLIAVMNAVPFILFSVFALLHLGLIPSDNGRLARRRAAGILMAAIAGIGLSGWTHLSTLLYPDAQGALAYVFLPVVLLIVLPVGYAGGRLVGALSIR